MKLPDFPPPLLTPFSRLFYEGIAQGELRLPVCPECGRIYWYPPTILPCHPDSAPAWRAVSPEARVYSFTRIERSLLPDADPRAVPYTLVMAHPTDAPNARIIGVLVDAEEEGPVQCDDMVRFQPIRVRDHWIPGFARAAQSQSPTGDGKENS